MSEEALDCEEGEDEEEEEEEEEAEKKRVTHVKVGGGAPLISHSVMPSVTCVHMLGCLCRRWCAIEWHAMLRSTMAPTMRRSSPRAHLA
jgi:hypothetical protein